MNPHTIKARLLLEQDNYTRAEESALLALQDDPHDADALTVLALALSHRGEKKEALEKAREAVGLAPDSPYSHFILACVAHDQGDLTLAQEAAEDSLELDPEQAGVYGLLANIHLRRKKHKEAYQASREGLRFDAENEFCRNIHARAMALMGRGEEAGEVLSQSLANHPDSSMTHANLGWVHLQNGRHHESLESFREALRLEPDNDNARQGMIQAIKARNVLFRVFLAYAHWLGRLPQGIQTAFIIGLWLGMQVISRVGDSNPGLQPFAIGLGFLYLGFVYTTWTIDALFNVLLFFHPYGRHALKPYEKWVTLGLAGAIGLGMLLMLGGAWVAVQFRVISVLAAALFLGGMCYVGLGIPVASLYRTTLKSNRIILGLEVAAFFVAINAAMVLSLVQPGALAYFRTIVLGLVLSTWVNSFILARDR